MIAQIKLSTGDIRMVYSGEQKSNLYLLIVLIG